MANSHQETMATSTEPTMQDLYNLLKNCAQKDDINTVKCLIQSHTEEINHKIENINEQMGAVSAASEQNANDIETLQISIESLKQEQLKNNISVSGVPANLLKNNKCAEAIIKIANKLDVQLDSSHFTAYTVSNGKLIVAHMHNIQHKQIIIDKIRAKKSLMVEEVFNTKSNSQIYVNDQLTPYHSKLFQIARMAKRETKIVSVTSYGGKVKVRKCIGDAPIHITSEKQLKSICESSPDAVVNLTQANIDNSMATSSQSTAGMYAHSSNSSQWTTEGEDGQMITRNGKRKNDAQANNAKDKKPKN